MGKDKRQRVKKGGEVKVVYTHGKKKNAIANAVVQPGKGSITVNRIALQNVEPRTLRVKLFEPLLFNSYLLGGFRPREHQVSTNVNTYGHNMLPRSSTAS